jgi:methyl-accepting chemotaxis protein
MQVLKTLSFKFTVSILLLLIVVFSTLFVVQSGLEQKALIKAINTKGNNLSLLLASSAVRPILTYNFDIIEQIAGEAVKDNEVAFVEFKDADGNELGKAGEELEADNVQYFVKDIKGEEGIKLGRLKLGINKIPFIQKKQSALKMQLLIYFLTALILSVVLMFLVQFLIKMPIKKLEEIAKQLENADLSQRVEVKQQDEIGNLAMRINGFIDRIHQVMFSVLISSEETASAGEELSSTSVALSDNIQKQFKLIENTDELVTDIGQNLDRTEEIAITTTEVIEESKEELDELVQKLDKVSEDIVADSNEQLKLTEKMKSLNSEAEKVKGVIAIISEIADQTNLLSLNAAIEAAQAGKHGKGFAVVADEVRKLAENTQKSLEEIDAITTKIVNSIAEMHTEIERTSGDILDISEESKQVIGIATKTKDKLEETVITASELTKMSTYIATKTKELIEIMEELTKLSAENKNSGDNVKAVADELARRSAELTELLSYFKLQ